MNKEWHMANPMPAKPTITQRIAWHINHRQHCNCRPIPPKLLKEMEKQGLAVFKDK